MNQERTPVERLRIGDRVRAVPYGPVGTVESHVSGWAIVQYPTRSKQRGAGVMNYKHDEESLLLEAVER